MEQFTRKGRVCTALVAVLSLVTPSYSCLTGRYGRYENWPSNNDWDELLSLVTGKYGSGGWGWSNTDSFAYNSIGNYPLGNLKYTSSPWGTSGSSGAGGSYYSSAPSGSSGFGSSSFKKTTGSKVTTDQLRNALNSYFKESVSKPSSSYGGSDGGSGSDNGWIGESFVDSPGPGPPYHDDIRAPGPPYNDGPLIRGSTGAPFHSPSGGGSPFPGNSHEQGPPPPSYGPSYDRGKWPSGGGGGPPASGEHWPSGPPSTGPPQHDYSPPSNPPSNYLNSNESPSGQFQSDFDTFGPYNKRRREGRRRSHVASRPQFQKEVASNNIRESRRPPQRPNNRQQRNNNLPSNGPPHSTQKPYKFPPYPGTGPSGRPRKQRKMGAPPPISERRQLLKTSFGGYKVDHRRLHAMARSSNLF